MFVITIIIAILYPDTQYNTITIITHIIILLEIVKCQLIFLFFIFHRPILLVYDIRDKLVDVDI